MDKKTTSIFQSFELGAAFATINTQLIVRTPANLKVFRCTIYVSVDAGSTSGNEVFLSNQEMFSTYDGVQLSCNTGFQVNTNIPPATDAGTQTLVKNQLILDRRGVGYMQDNFYCFGKGFINFVWEGEIS